MMSGVKVVGVIPARYASKRLPGKPLADICGEPMVVRVWERAVRSSVFEQVLVATDDERIAAVCRERTIPVVMTDAKLASGSDRVFAALQAEQYDIAVNIQGDEPLVDPGLFSILIRPLLQSGESSAVASLVCPLKSQGEFGSPHVVKAVFGDTGRALYFSRSPIPYSAEGVPPQTYRHIGLYAFTKEALASFVSLPQGMLEQQERLEQLRLLEANIPIYLSTVSEHACGVDTEEDLERVRRIFRENGGSICPSGQ